MRTAHNPNKKYYHCIHKIYFNHLKIILKAGTSYFGSFNHQCDDDDGADDAIVMNWLIVEMAPVRTIGFHRIETKFINLVQISNKICTQWMLKRK